VARNEEQVTVVDEVAAQDRVALPKARAGKSMKLEACLKRQTERHVELNFHLLELARIIMLITSTCSSWFGLFVGS
jgi:hypothetical protein